VGRNIGRRRGGKGESEKERKAKACKNYYN
jgi:hypothetical protein